MSEVVKTKSKMDFAKLVKVLIFLFGIHFLLFGYICNAFGKQPGDNLLFVYTSFFNGESYLALPILVGIYVLMAVNEDFLLIAVKKAFWSVPFIVIYEIFWYTWNYLWYRDLAEVLQGPIQVGVENWYDPVVTYFTSYQGYLNIVILLIVCIGSAVLGSYMKIKYRERFQKRSVERNEFS